MKKSIVMFVLIVLITLGSVGTVSADPSISTEEVLVVSTENPHDFSSEPDGIYVFIYHGYAPFFGTEIDTMECVEDRLYVYDAVNNAVTEISEQTVVLYTCTENALYYVTDSQKLYKTDYAGENHLLLYQCKLGQLHSLSCYLTTLYFIENNCNVMFVDTETGAAINILSVENLDWIFLLNEVEMIVATTTGDYFRYNCATKEITQTGDMEATSLINQAVLAEEKMAEAGTSVMSLFQQSSVTQENNITFPLDEYPAAIYDNSTTYNFMHYKPLSWFHINHQEGCSEINCRKYSQTGECEGFARYAHDVYMHMVENNPGYSTWLSARHPGSKRYFNGSATTVKNFFESLNTGAYIRYGKDSDPDPEDGVHSIVFVSAEQTGIWVYECNQSYYKYLTEEEIGDHLPSYFGCGIHFQFYTYAKLATQYQYVLHYINHSYSENIVCNTVSYHRAYCADCNGYLLQNHTGNTTYTIKTLHQHVFSASCCSGEALYTHTAGQTRTITNSTAHAVGYPCCDGTIAENHIATVNYTYSNLLKHQVTAACCTGTVNESHTDSSYIIYSTSQHQIFFRCCDKIVYQQHMFKNGKCSGCGYVEGGFVIQPGKIPIIEATE